MGTAGQVPDLLSWSLTISSDPCYALICEVSVYNLCGKWLVSIDGLNLISVLTVMSSKSAKQKKKDEQCSQRVTFLS